MLEDNKERRSAIEPLPANGTVSISTEGAADTDMNVIPPEGVTVVIESDTVTVTNQTVDFERLRMTQEMVTQEMVTQEMVTQERKIHQKKGNKIPYLLFVPRLDELTKATQFIDLFNEDGRSSLYYFHSSFKNLSLYKAISTVSLWSENSLSIFSLNCLTNALVPLKYSERTVFSCYYYPHLSSQHSQRTRPLSLLIYLALYWPHLHSVSFPFVYKPFV